MNKTCIILTAGLSTILLTGCASTKKIDISTKPVELNIYQPADPAPVKLLDMKFKVVTKDTVDSFINDQVKIQDNPNPVFVVMSVKDYKAMSLNVAELRRYINQQQKIIVYYKKATAAKQ